MSTSAREISFLDRKDGDLEISVIVPVYMGLPFLEELAQRLVASLETISPDFEVLFVDDRSADNAWPLIVSLGQSDARIKGIRLSRNFGQHPAITAGIDHARGRWLVIMDCDLQDAPEDIPLLYQRALAAGVDIVIAKRHEQVVSRRRRISSYVFHHALAWLGDIDTSPQIGNFRIFSRRVAHAFQLYREQFRLLPALMARLGFSVDYLEVSRGARRSGRSSYSFGKLFRLATDAVIANSEKPLWLGIYLGLSIATIAFALSIWALYRRLLYGGSIDGWASLFIAVSFFSGVQLTFSGILGVYLGRVYNETKNRPLYLVADTSSLSQASLDTDGDRSAEPERTPRRRRSGKAEG